MPTDTPLAALLALPAGRELDAAVAEHVLGRPVVWDTRCWIIPARGQEEGTATGRLGYADTERSGRALDEVDYFSTDIAAAWTVLDALEDREFWWTLDGGWKDDGNAVTLFHRGYGGGGTGPTVCAESVPLAICRAALKAMVDGVGLATIRK